MGHVRVCTGLGSGVSGGGIQGGGEVGSASDVEDDFTAVARRGEVGGDSGVCPWALIEVGTGGRGQFHILLGTLSYQNTHFTLFSLYSHR